MRIALTKYLCTCDNNEQEDIEVLDELLHTAITRNQYFSFFNQCDRRLLIKYHLYDKHFVEFKGNHLDKTTIVYSVNGADPVEEDMIEMYDGLFVKQFVLFFGDQLRYEIYCDAVSDKSLDTTEITYSDNAAEAVGGRFGMMNAMNRHSLYSQTTELMTAMKKYNGLSVVTKDLFNII